MFYKNYLQLLTLIICCFFRIQMSWNFGDNRNLFLKLKSKLGLFHVGIRKPNVSPEKITLTPVKTQQLTDFEEADSENEISCLKRTIYKGRRNVCINFQTDSDKVNNVVHRYRNNTYLRVTETELRLTEYEKLLAKRVYLFSYIDVFIKRCIVLNETTVHNWFKICHEWTFSFW